MFNVVSLEVQSWGISLTDDDWRMNVKTSAKEVLSVWYKAIIAIYMTQYYENFKNTVLNIKINKKKKKKKKKKAPPNPNTESMSIIE